MWITHVVMNFFSPSYNYFQRLNYDNRKFTIIIKFLPNDLILVENSGSLAKCPIISRKTPNSIGKQTKEEIFLDLFIFKAFLIHGPAKSSLRNPRILKPEMPLCGMGVFMDGASSRHMRSKPLDLVRQQEERDNLQR